MSEKLNKEIEKAFNDYREKEHLKKEIEVVIPAFIDFEAGWNAAFESIPKHETPEQYKKRTGKDYPDDGPVWSVGGPEDYENLTGLYWELVTYEDVKMGKSNGFYVLIATPEHGKPSADWRP